MSEFSNRFRQLKDEFGLSAKDLATKLDIAPSTLSYYLKDREPNYDMLIKIANYFDVTIDWLVGNNTASTKYYERKMHQLELEINYLYEKLEKVKGIIC